MAHVPGAAERGAKDGVEMDVKRKWGKELYPWLRCPCKRCEKREVGCHTGCEEYAAFRLRSEEAKERVQDMRMDALGHALR